MKGKLILVTGSSGSGKGVLLKHLYEQFTELVSPVSCTTRAPRPQDVEGEKYYFVSEEEFDKRIANGEFLEWAFYGGHRYGTLKSEILEPLEAGANVLREVEIQGAHAIAKLVPQDSLKTIFIDAGSWEGLKKRIVARAPMPEEELLKRYERYQDEQTFITLADFVVENKDGKLEEAKEAIEQIVRDILSS